jgi:hypothetical protein
MNAIGMTTDSILANMITFIVLLAAYILFIVLLICLFCIKRIKDKVKKILND